MDDGSPIKLKKRPRLSTVFSYCVICQKSTKETLAAAQPESIKKFLDAGRIRQDEIFERASLDTEEIYTKTVLWHKNCYKSYTSRTNLERFQRSLSVNTSKTPLANIPEHEVLNDRAATRQSLGSTPVDWSLCLFCQKTKFKGERLLINLCTKQAEQSLRNAADVLKDDFLKRKIALPDLIAQEAKYHKVCHQNYLSAANRVTLPAKDRTVYEKAFDKVKEIVDVKIIRECRAIEMSTLREQYEDFLIDGGIPQEEAHCYKGQKLKARLIRCYENNIVFHKPFEANKSEIVYSSKIQIKDVINRALEMNEAKEAELSSDISYTPEDNVPKLLYYAALILRSEMKGCSGLDCNPVNPSDINNELAKSLIPKALLRFIKWLVSPEKQVHPQEEMSDETTSEQTERTMLSICQDLIFANSAGEKKMPKHIGLASTVQHIWRAKSLVTMLNRHGHCISYDSLKRIDTKWANMMKSVDDNPYAVIPSNIQSGVFTQAAADNADFNINNLDGKDSVHVTSVVLYQEKSHQPIMLGAGRFPSGDDNAAGNQRSRSIKLPKRTISHFQVSPKRAEPTLSLL